MIFTIFKKIALEIPLLVFSIPLFAMSHYCSCDNQDCCCDGQEPEPIVECSEEIVYPELGCIPCAYNCPARIDVNGCWNIYLTGSFIYWIATEENLSFFGNRHSNDGVKIYGHIYDVDFDYKPGFKVGLGTYFDKDNWGLYAEYTRLHEKINNSFSTQPVAKPAFDIMFNSNAPFRGYYNWKLGMDIIDLEMSRAYYVGRNLTFNPFVCLRSAFIDQKYHFGFIGAKNTTANPGNNFSGYINSSSWGIGPRVGIDTAWELCKGFKILGNAAGSILYSRA